MKSRTSSNKRKPFEIVRSGSISIPIYRQMNIIPRRDAGGKIIYRGANVAGKARPLVKYEIAMYTAAYYEGQKRIRLKFSDLDKAH